MTHFGRREIFAGTPLPTVGEAGLASAKPGAITPLSRWNVTAAQAGIQKIASPLAKEAD